MTKEEQQRFREKILGEIRFLARAPDGYDKLTARYIMLGDRIAEYEDSREQWLDMAAKEETRLVMVGVIDDTSLPEDAWRAGELLLGTTQAHVWKGVLKWEKRLHEARLERESIYAVVFQRSRGTDAVPGGHDLRTVAGVSSPVANDYFWIAYDFLVDGYKPPTRIELCRRILAEVKKLPKWPHRIPRKADSIRSLFGQRGWFEWGRDISETIAHILKIGKASLWGENPE